MSPTTQFQPTCHVCGRGVLDRVKVYRLSGCAVVVGYVILIPTVIGMAAGGFVFIGSFLPVEPAVAGSEGLPQEVALAAGGAGLMLFFASLVGGLLGWLLVMKKWVLRCTSCRATIAAN